MSSTNQHQKSSTRVINDVININVIKVVINNVNMSADTVLLFSTITLTGTIHRLPALFENRNYS
ncbi:hypothetical protein FRX31_010784 [Thalictrum thalictroides]|uniref:Uncharacterized protein n=1 Tax=Thalictrum thalictroides TaxID=46969 RepID=A0A7J6WQI7_THATH|nr:hypothetical protein FRX31_010784 [Thalictrum thalictroides]